MYLSTRSAICGAWAMGLMLIAATAASGVTADAGANQQVTDTDQTGAETVTLDGSGSSDDGTIVSYVWTEGGAQIASGPMPQVSLGVRLHEITLTVTDDQGHTDSDTVNVRVFAKPPPVQLDISSAFNVDAWCGPLEYQALQEHAYNYGAQDLSELQGGSVSVGVGWLVLNAGSLLVGNSSEAGFSEPYSITTNWFHPDWLTGTEGTSEDGVLTGADRAYHVASTLGNDTLTGNWLEVADPAAEWATRANAMIVYSPHRLDGFQVSEVTVELPAAQKEPYADINFVIAAMDTADRARNMRLVALYGPAGTVEQELYAFSTADGGSGPKMAEQNGGADFAVLSSSTRGYNNDAGSTGSISTVSGSFYEFASPLPLNGGVALWGFRVEDTAPDLWNNARGVVVFAATARPATAQGYNLPPVARAGADQALEDEDLDLVETVTLDGSASADADGDVVGWVWSEGGQTLATGATAELQLGLGEHTITLTVTDNEGATDTDTVVVTVGEGIPPVTYYVDFGGGDDGNDGRSPETAFKHCPGDPAATGNADATVLRKNDTVRFKGGVVYYGQVPCLWSGEPGKPITYDGNTDGSWGTGRAVVDGSAVLGGWTPCQSAEECDGNPDWQNIYWTYLPAGLTAWGTWLFEDDQLCGVAQHPNPSDVFWYDEVSEYLVFDSATDTSIVDADYFIQADPNHWNGSTYILIHAGNNTVYRRAVTGYVPTAHEIRYAPLGVSHYDPGRYAMVNSLKILDRPGEYVVREDQAGPGGGLKIYLWPYTSGTAGKTFTLTARPYCFHLEAASHVTIQGFLCRKSSSGEAAITNDGGKGASGLTIRDNVIEWSRSTGVGLDDVTDSLVAENTVANNYGRGIIINRAYYSSIADNTLDHNAGTAIDYYRSEHSSILGNTVLNHDGHHANGITCYVDCDDILIAGNFVADGNIACTTGHGCTNMTIAYNILLSNGGYAYADWGNCDGVQLLNNVIQGGGVVAFTSTTNLVARNNIMSGSGLAHNGHTSEYNLYTGLSWTQDPDNLEPGELYEPDLAAVFVDAANRDYRLAEGSPGIDAGVDVGLAVDHAGHLVPVGSAPDMGAFEFGSFAGSVVAWRVVDSHGGSEIAGEVGDGYIEPRAAGLRILRITFASPVDPETVGPEAVTIAGDVHGDQAALVASVSLVGDDTVEVTLAGPLPNADRYSVTVAPSLELDSGEPMTGDLELRLAVLIGDVNGSGAVDAADVVALREAVGQSATGSDARFDLDGSGAVTGADLMQIRAHLGESLP